MRTSLIHVRVFISCMLNEMMTSVRLELLELSCRLLYVGGSNFALPIDESGHQLKWLFDCVHLLSVNVLIKLEHKHDKLVK